MKRRLARGSERWRLLPPAQRRVATWLAAALVLLLLAGVALRGVIGEHLWPAQRAQQLRVQAEAALAAGRLSASDGTGARELYEAALALQPDQVEARAGLGRVAEAALAQAGRHADAGRIAHARIALRLADELDAPRPKLDAMARRLAGIEAGGGRIEALLARADAALAAGRLDKGEDAALPLYQRVVLLQPRNQRAMEGREDALADLLAPAPAALAAGDLARAADLVRRAERFDAGHAALPALREQLGRAVEHASVRVDGLLARGEVDAAASACLRLRALAWDGAASGCAAKVGDRLLAEARRHIGEFRFEAAGAAIGMATSLGADAGLVAGTEARLQQAMREAGRLAVPTPTPQTRRRLDDMLARAEQAGQRGNWLSPPGDSAWDHLRQARALAPDDPRVRRALQAMLPTARRCNAEGLRDNNLGRAQGCFDAWQQLAPADPGLAAARRRMGERWLGVGAQRLADGDIDGTRHALARARGLQPDLPGIAALSERIARASVGGN